MALLVVVEGLNPGQRFQVEGDRAVLGRHPDCDIVLDVGAISRQHAQILHVGGEYFVEDLKSRNGTYVNGRAIEGRHRLVENDELKICDLLFTFHEQEPDASSLLLPPKARPEVEDESSSITFLDEAEAAGAQIMSSLDVQTSRSGIRLNINPEVKLQALLEITRNLGTTIKLDQVLPRVLDSLFKIFVQADRGFVVLKEGASDTLVPKALKHRRADHDDSIRLSRAVVAQVMGGKEAILSADAASDARFDSSQSVADFRIRSMMCAPLLDSEGTAVGMIQIDTQDQRTRFSKDDLEVLAAVASQAGIAVENAQLHESALANRAMERDLQLAHRVQQGILPSAPPVLPGYEFFDFYESANQIGGDYFDYVPLPGNRLAIVLADVSGKGVAAALLMAKLSSEARYCLASQPDPAQAMQRISEGLSHGSWEDRFVTMVAAVIDLNTHTLSISNAGHMAPLLRRSGKQPLELGAEETGLPLGVDASTAYQMMSVTLKPGDCVTFFTDGVSEAMNAKNDIYGLVRLRKVLASRVADGVSGLGKRILDDVKKFAGTRAQSDDMCLLCFGRTKE